MSSLRNAVKRVTHKERSQPQARRRFGLLEKKSDYKARADDFHKKEDAIARLRAKADGRNPDEFSFGMVHDRTRGGVPEGGDARTYTADELALMRTQDVRYVAMAAGVEAKRIERLRSNLHGLGAADAARAAAAAAAGAGASTSAPAPHTVFVDSKPEAARFSPAAYFDTPADLLARAHNRPRRGQVATGGAVVVGGQSTPHARAAMKADKRRAASYKELSQRAGRLARLRALEGRLRLQGALQGKGSKKKVVRAGVRGEPAVYKWRRVRTK